MQWLIMGALTAVVAGPAAGAGSAQDARVEVMEAAARHVVERLPTGPVRLDPHRTGPAGARELAERLASQLGASLGTLEETRRCVDVMDPSTCRLEGAAVLLAIAAPSIRGDEARVRVYAWYRQSSPREPVGKLSTEVRLRRGVGGWTVVAGGA